jgi:hypothetical protein
MVKTDNVSLELANLTNKADLLKFAFSVGFVKCLYIICAVKPRLFRVGMLGAGSKTN